MKRAALVAILAIAAAPTAAKAQRAGVAERLPPDAPPAVQSCVGCHGYQGEGNPDAGAPRIAGQSQRYLVKQLDSYTDGTRRSRVMEPIARGLPPEIRADVARYYARSAVRAVEHEAGQPPERGRVLALEGDNTLGVQACANCHGPGGVGEPPNIPYIAGLDAEYIAHELRAWKEGTRTNDAGRQMFTVVTALSESDMDAVARYYASLAPPEPAPPDLVQPRPPSRPEIRVERADVEPGAPEGRVGAGQGGAGATTGGTQGAGGAGASALEEQDGESQAGERAPPAAETRTEPAQPEGRVGAGQGGAGATTGGTQGAGGTGESALEKDGDGTDGGGKPPGRGEAQQRPKRPRWPAIIDEPKQEEPRSLAPSVPGDPEHGRAIVTSGEYGCPACHAIPGVAWPRGIVGPPLDDFGSRAFIAGRLPNNPQTLAAFVFNAPALVPETGMPDLAITLEEARHVAAYLGTLGAGDAR